ncbi:MAG: hypothetical protein JXQ72_17300 [Anaerolineae bacterium]|nr:hypothetical protein [Anaerolineae bacterium]
MQRMEYKTVYLSGNLDFPDTVDRAEKLSWAGKSISQQLNEQAADGWEVMDLHWLSDTELMVTFRRERSTSSD